MGEGSILLHTVVLTDTDKASGRKWMAFIGFVFNSVNKHQISVTPSNPHIYHII